MSQDMGTDPSQQTQPSNQSGSRGNSHMLLYIIIAIVAIVVIVILLYPSPSGPVITQNKSLSSNPIYMSPSQVQTLFSSQLTNYSTSDLFNPNSPINMSDLVGSVPQLYGNATSGWLTTASGTSTLSNQSIEYFAIEGSNTTSMAKLLGASATSSLNITPSTVYSGAQGGFNYTYGTYQNSTVEYQTLYGWKNDTAVLALVEENPGYSVNPTTLIGIAENDT